MNAGWSSPMHEEDEYPEDFVTRGEMKKVAQELQDLGERLVELPEAHWEQFTLPEELIDSLRTAKRLQSRKREGLRRQNQRIGKLMTQLDADLVRKEFSAYRARIHKNSQANPWAEKLLSEASALTDFCEKYPETNVQLLRQLIRAAKKASSPEKQTSTLRKLEQFLREIGL